MSLNYDIYKYAFLSYQTKRLHFLYAKVEHRRQLRRARVLAFQSGADTCDQTASDVVKRKWSPQSRGTDLRYSLDST